jgi:hypothetical protein
MAGAEKKRPIISPFPFFSFIFAAYFATIAYEENVMVDRRHPAESCLAVCHIDYSDLSATYPELDGR